MDKYKRLLSNVLTFGIGTFGSKLLVFVLMPYYTMILSSGEYGTANLVTNVSNLLMPIFSVGIASAVIRFALDKAYDKSTVFTGGLVSIFGGFLLFLVLSPFIFLIPFMSSVRDYSTLILLFVLFSALKSSCSVFVRSMQYVKLFALDGILSTLTTIVLNIVFLSVFHMGVEGYILATICGDFLSVIFLFFMADLWKYINFKKFRFFRSETFRGMLRYSIPLIPTSLFWWVTNLSDRFIIVQFLGQDVNGWYEAANRIPTIIVMVSNIFTEAWQMSAVMEKDSEDQSNFYSTVFSSFSSLIFLACSGVILFTKPLMNILVSWEGSPSWQYVPLLTLAMAYSCLATYLGSVFTVKKKSVMSLLTVITGAVTNIVLNFILIPTPLGANGAALATFVSYVVVFVMRVLVTRRMIHIRIGLPKLLLNTALVGAQTYVLLTVKLWILPELVLFALVALLNGKSLLLQAKKLLRR